VTGVDVIEWNGAGRLAVSRGGDSLLLRPGGRSSWSRPDASIFAGAARWVASRKGAGGGAGLPRVRVRHVCPKEVRPVAHVPQGYRLVRSDALHSVGRALWRQGVGDVILDRGEDEESYVVRVREGTRHDRLEVELEGTDHSYVLPMARSGADAWTVDHRAGGVHAWGSVRRTASTLEIRIDGARVRVGRGAAVELVSSSLALELY
jgi:hypothetical protein